LGGVALFGLVVASSAFKFLRGDYVNAVSDITKLIGAVGETVKATSALALVRKKFEGVATRLNKYAVGRVLIRGAKAIYDIATSPHVKTILQITTAALSIASAATPVGWALGALALGAVVGSGIKALANARSLRLLEKTRDFLRKSRDERRVHQKLLTEYRDLACLASLNNTQKSTEDKAPVQVIGKGELLAKSLASSIVGGGCAILEAAVSRDPVKQIGTAVALLGGTAKEVEAGVKQETKRLDLKKEIAELGGSGGMREAQKEMLEERSKTQALKMLTREIKAAQDTNNPLEKSVIKKGLKYLWPKPYLTI